MWLAGKYKEVHCRLNLRATTKQAELCLEELCDSATSSVDHGTGVTAGPRLRDPRSWPPLAAGACSRNLGPILSQSSVLEVRNSKNVRSKVLKLLYSESEIRGQRHSIKSFYGTMQRLHLSVSHPCLAISFPCFLPFNPQLGSIQRNERKNEERQRSSPTMQLVAEVRGVQRAFVRHPSASRLDSRSPS